MIYCLTKKPEDYNSAIGGGSNGLFYNYGNDPHLFSLLSRVCTGFFMYEEGFEDFPAHQRLAILEPFIGWEESLEASIAGIPVRTALETMSPRQFTELFYEHMPEEFPLCAAFPPHPTSGKRAGGVWFNMYLRVLQHEKYYRGKLRDNTGKVVGAAFASRISAQEDEFLEQQKTFLKDAMKEVMNAKRVS